MTKQPAFKTPDQTLKGMCMACGGTDYPGHADHCPELTRRRNLKASKVKKTKPKH